jgi:GalNAc5-diNAcBac-PP-undecaprenol beta-1,3-glucosyltransferase
MDATVLVPTHDHGPTLLRSVRSALAQTDVELEVFVVGDGVPDVTRELAAELMGEDDRVRFFDNEKGPRHGELHRHAALAEAAGEIVCYLSDDDLWLPGHVTAMRALLAEHDFANALPLRVEPDGSLAAWIVDLSLSSYRELLLSGENRIPLSCAAHTLEHYRRLPHGWRTAPAGIPSDLYMFQQILAVPDVRAASGANATVLHFASSRRVGNTPEERVAELDRFAGGVGETDVRAALVRAGADIDVERMRLSANAAALEDALGEAGSYARSVEAALERLSGERAELDRARAELAGRVEALEKELALTHERLQAISGSVTWRLRTRAVGVPVAGPLLRAAARALVGRRAR